MQIPVNLSFTNVQLNKAWVQNFVQALAQYWKTLATAFNGNIGFGDGSQSDNVNGIWKSVTSPASPNTDLTITHNLGRVPVGYIVMTKSAACDVYTGSVAATSTEITLRFTTASVDVSLFIL